MAHGCETTYLNGNLAEVMYMIQLEDFNDPNYVVEVCKLKRSIYCLKHESVKMFASPK